MVVRVTLKVEEPVEVYLQKVSEPLVPDVPLQVYFEASAVG